MAKVFKTSYGYDCPEDGWFILAGTYSWLYCRGSNFHSSGANIVNISDWALELGDGSFVYNNGHQELYQDWLAWKTGSTYG